MFSILPTRTALYGAFRGRFFHSLIIQSNTMTEQQPTEQKNPFTEAFNEYRNSKAAARLEQKFRPRPYYQRRAALRLFALCASYLFNTLSAVTAAVPIYFFLFALTDAVAVGAVGAVAFVIVLEIGKRLAANPTFSERLKSGTLPPVIVVVVLLTALSVTLSYHGAKTGFEKAVTPPPPANLDSIAAPYFARIDTLTAQRIAAENTRYTSGNTTRESRQTVAILTEQIARIDTERAAAVADAKRENKAVALAAATDTGFTAQIFALFTLLCEVCFLWCVGYCNYYDFRSHTEMELVRKRANPTPEPAEDMPPEIATESDPPNPLPPDKNDNGQRTTPTTLPPDTADTVTTDNGQKIPKPLPSITPKKHRQRPAPKKKKAASSVPTSDEYRAARKKYNTYKSKLKRGNGKAETNRAGMERERAKMDAIESRNKLKSKAK